MSLSCPSCRRVHAAGDRRADCGLSMGGFGAFSCCLHPDMFAAVTSFSGIVHTRLSLQVSQNYLGLLRSEGAGSGRALG